MATTVEQVEVLLEQKVGELKEDIAALRGDVQSLTTELRLGREAQERAEGAHAELHRDYERRLRFLERAVWIAAGAGAIGGGVGSALLGG